ncbi:MAG TPA: fumarate hydratase [Elusimicrobiota bacterium]|nr:fumarate hydratase [Elusimicrobiota bacterium]
MPSDRFQYEETFQLGPDETRYRLLSRDGVRVDQALGKDVLVVEPRVLEDLAYEAMRDVSFLLRPAHQEQVAAVLRDPAASANDKSVALTLLRNSAISAKFELPMCQDTGTAIVFAKKGERVWTGADDAESLSKGIWRVYTQESLRYSQVAPLSMYEEVNTGDNLPAQIDILAGKGMRYDFLFLAKGGGSANKMYLFQETKALLNPESLKRFLAEKMRTLGTAGCPPYHLAFAIGGTSADACMKAVKLASAGYYDALPDTGSRGGRAFRDRALEKEALEMAYQTGIGAQFGGKYFAHDVKIVRLPRHGASCPVGMAVSCSADRNIRARIDQEGVWLEEMERDPERLIPAEFRSTALNEGSVRLDLNRPIKEVLAELSRYPVTTRLSLSGRLIVARDIAHAKLKERLDRGEELPAYFRDHPIYYAGPAKTPQGKPSGSFGPTTSGRMDSYADLFMSKGASLITLGKGNRAPAVAQACKKWGGFYLGSIGGPAAILAQESIKKVELVEYPELGMEAVYAIDVVDFPAYILIDDKGNDFFRR